MFGQFAKTAVHSSFHENKSRSASSSVALAAIYCMMSSVLKSSFAVLLLETSWPVSSSVSFLSKSFTCGLSFLGAGTGRCGETVLVFSGLGSVTAFGFDGMVGLGFVLSGVGLQAGLGFVGTEGFRAIWGLLDGGLGCSCGCDGGCCWC